MERRQVVIVGGGPAGAATALYLLRHAPHIAADTVLLEQASHPRDKVCAGGLIPHVLDCLEELEIPLSVSHLETHKACVEVFHHRVKRQESRLCTVVRRREFDRMLIDEVIRRGLEVRQRERVAGVDRAGGRVIVKGQAAGYHAPVVIGADGSGSLVRRSLGMSQPGGSVPIGRAVLRDLPIDRVNWDGYRETRYDFDFRGVAKGLKGYAWAFPTLIDRVPHVNVGVYARRSRQPRLEVRLLAEKCAELGCTDHEGKHKAWPIRWYSPRQTIASANVLLVGDAAGVDPLMGEGISYCFEYGRWAAREIADAFAATDFSFAGAQSRFRDSWVGKKLVRLGIAADFFYGPAAPLCFALAARWQGAQDVGLKWYNGVDGWDRKSGWRALLRAMRGAGAESECEGVTRVIRS